ncbi:MAG: Rieske 2Fe-2S domain-containing protein [Haloferacaceae archaeon]
MSTDDAFRKVTSLDRLREAGREVVQVDGRAVALFSHEDSVYAVDNRCPHMGFPLSKGTVEEGILTCHWHHARFELEEGDTFDPWADDVQTFPVEVLDGDVYVDPDPEQSVPEDVRWRNRLADGLNENLPLVVAKAVVGLDEHGDGFHTPVETAVEFGTKYRETGWGRGLTTLGAMANLHGRVGGRDRRRAMFVGVKEVADECAGEPPRFQQYPFDNRRLPKDRLESWFRETVEVRDADGAERCLLTAVECLEPADVASVAFASATDHLYMNAGHTLDFLNKAFETIDVLGWEEHAGPVLASTVRQLTDATRSEELSSWRQPIDVASLCFDAADRLPELVASGEGREWDRPDGFVERLLEDDPEAIVDALTGAIRAGATTEELSGAVARAATRRVAYFSTNNEFADWNTVHHTFTYANALHEATRRTDAIELYRGCFDAAMSTYLDRFLNQPRAPIPETTPSDDGGVTDSTREPEAIREELLAAFDERGDVNRAARLVAEHFDADGDLAALRRVLGRGLLREDAGFHTLQNVEAAFRRVDRVDDEAGRRMALMATARYMAAHFPTRREDEQTFSIATRLHRGERLHEVS